MRRTVQILHLELMSVYALVKILAKVSGHPPEVKREHQNRGARSTTLL